MTAPLAEGVVWCVFYLAQWPEPYACDFIFVTGDLAGRMRDVRVNCDTDASDHQPVLLSP